VFPSLYEGFGLPIIEAQLAGVPVICASGTALPEVAGDAAVLIDPVDEDGWATALAEPIEPETRRMLVEAGLRNAARYSPAAMATAQVHAYRLAISEAAAP